MHVVKWNAILAPEMFFPLKLEKQADTTAACRAFQNVYVVPTSHDKFSVGCACYARVEHAKILCQACPCQMILTRVELFLASSMIGMSDVDILIQGYLDEAKNTLIFLQQLAACREILNIISWRFPSFKKGISKTYKLLFCILHNSLPFRGELPVPFGMWNFAQARLIRIQNSVKRLKFSKVGVKKGSRAGKKLKKAKKTSEEKITEKNKKF
ncbi:hypothetical protein DAPPUDRAFT_331655 [Daphnia pulex]|uniref:Uncharacterized protein n=1 Tax=Daphnia pulex TaxID=6669 RepID=E9HN14_DAPPU|nr:hypothetical protein DAPPUDRAFT_331655 [Daphnia pulex]|eukprot:EFX66873.1 hypothetical protein DAPPUDRAFT_331655 [Daphnia pulex]